jgi:NAD(P)H-dependent flavin oxidoreductase YrpB (nitropropane dioxygenase family)
MSLLAGQVVGLVDEIRPAADILRKAVNGAERLIRELSAKVPGGEGNRPDSRSS